MKQCNLCKNAFGTVYHSNYFSGTNGSFCSYGCGFQKGAGYVATSFSGGGDIISPVGALGPPDEIVSHSHCADGSCNVNYANMICETNSYNTKGGWDYEIVETANSLSDTVVIKSVNENENDVFDDNTLNEVTRKYDLTPVVLVPSDEGIRADGDDNDDLDN